MLMIGLLIALAVNTTLAISTEGQRAPLAFDVYLDDEKIGTHEVNFERTDDTTTITTTAEFVYRILYIPVYRYEHRTVETWNEACLSSIDSQTDDNGDEFFIQSEAAAPGMLIRTREGEITVDECIRTYAYWDDQLLRTDKLLNTQNGRYQPITYNDKGTETYEFEDIRFEARRVELDTEEGIISLWYDAEDNWVALESKVESGAVVRYLSTTLTDSDQGDS